MSDASIERFHHPEELLEAATGWDALATAAPDPFTTTTWLTSWWRAFAADGDGEILVARRGSAIVGGLAIVRQGRRRHAMANTHSPVFRVLAADDEARSRIVTAALRGTVGLRLPAVPASDPLLAGGPWWRTSRPTSVSPIVETSGSFEAWRAESKKRWGAPLERFRRKMGREHALRLVLNEPPADLESELDRGFAVEGSGWKRQTGTAILSRPDTTRFYREVAAGFHARGELVCSSLELDGEMAAWDLSLLHDNRVFLLKTGYDERFRKLAPGLVLRLSVIESCFERGYLAHELLGHVDDWKPKFATTARPHQEVRLFPRSPAGAAGLATWRAVNASLPAVRWLQDRR